MSGMVWIKYYTTGHMENEDLENILDVFGTDGWGKYWLLLGLLALKYSDETKVIKVKNKVIMKSLHFKSKKKMESFLLSSEIKTILKSKKGEDFYSFDTSILLELKSRDFKTTRSKRTKTAHKNKINIKNKIKNKSYIYTSAVELIEAWNNYGLKSAPMIPDYIKRVHQGFEYQQRQGRGVTQLKESFKNYAMVINNPERFFFNWEYKLDSFLKSEKSEKFLPEEFNPAPFERKRGHQMRTTAQTRQDNLINMEFTPDEFK